MSVSTLQRALTQLGLRADPSLWCRLLAHEATDDLESCFYVLIDVLGTNGPSPTQPPLPALLAAIDYTEAYEVKDDCFHDNYRYDLDTLPPYWSTPTRELVDKFYERIRNIAVTKTRLVRGWDVKEEEYTNHKEKVPEYLRAIQEYFEVAVAGLADMDDTPHPPIGVLATIGNSPSLEHPEAPRTPESSASPPDIRSPLQPRVDDNYDAVVLPVEIKASPPRAGKGKRKASEGELENQPLPVRQRN